MATDWMRIEWEHGKQRFQPKKKLNPNEALASYEETLKINPDDVEALHNKGIMLSQLERDEEALRCFDQALKLKPDFAEAWDDKGVVLSNLEGPEAALPYFDKAVKLKPDLSRAWLHKGLSLANLGRLDEAAMAYIEANKHPSQWLKFQH